MIVHNNIRNGSGVSEAIGFLLMFTLVMAGIGLVTLYGFPMLLKQQTSADEKIMEKNMIVLQNDFKSIMYKTIPYKETSMKVASGALHVNNGMTTGPTFCIGSSPGGCEYLPVNPTGISTGDLRYLSSQSQEEISLQNGAVVKRDRSTPGGSVMLAQPRWYYDGNAQAFVVNIQSVNSSSAMSREGIGTIQMELGQLPDYPVEYRYLTYSATMPTRTVYIRYTMAPGQDYHTAWQNYFEQTLRLENCVWSSPNLDCQKSDVSTLVIKRTDIIIRSI